MGQRQTVALARAAANPAIVILDEATASIDPLTETLIQEGLDLVLEHRTAIVIAHRLSTVRHADRIIVLRTGAIIEAGGHNQLLEAAAIMPSCTTPTSDTKAWTISSAPMAA
jgi:ABC-type multidrug transport system fused ATPase/permease subunit